MFISSWHDIIVNLIYSTCSCTIGLIIKRVVIFDKYLTIDKGSNNSICYNYYYFTLKYDEDYIRLAEKLNTVFISNVTIYISHALLLDVVLSNNCFFLFLYRILHSKLTTLFISRETLVWSIVFEKNNIL